MKTTLKRGIGRSSGSNGNGRAILPPAVLSPIAIYRQPVVRRTRLQLVGRILLWLLAAAVMTAAGLAGGAYLFFDRTVAEVVATTPDVVRAQKQLDVALPGQPEIALIVGYDKRAGAEAAETGNSDTVMLVRADPESNAVSMLSFPRDMIVTVKCPGSEFRGRINSAYSECGSEGTLETVRALTGLPIHYLITVNFRGFKQIVAHMGGVWLDVDRRYFNDNSSGGERYAAIDLQPGYQKVNGADALDFVRYRHFDSDIYRLARQQMFIKAAKQRLSSFSATQFPGIIQAVAKNIEVGRIGSGSLGKKVLSYGLFAYQLPSGNFFQAKIDPATFSGSAELIPDDAAVQAAIADFANPDVAAPDKATAVALGRKLKSSTGPPASEVSVLVLNGNGIAGSASNAAAGLARIGYRIILPANGADANAPTFDYFRTKVYFDTQQKDAKAAAQRIGRLFGDADVEPLPPEIAPLSNGAMAVATVGQTFHGTLTPTPADKTPPKTPPVVERNPGASRDALLGVRGKAGFPLMLPTVIEQTSFLTSSVPVRAYDLEGHRAVRLVFSTGASEYWGIQQTDWEDAPVLNEPNTKQRIGGREYELHYNGPKLHMVVLRANGATYWVVNTLLDTLSNETMIAIAKGLRPLARS